MLDQFADWIARNRNEFIIIHFNHDIRTFEEDDNMQIAQDIEKMVRAKWDSPSSAVRLFRSESVPATYPTLQELIDQNTRVWIWLAPAHSRNTATSGWFQNANKGGFYSDTWDTEPVTTSCYGIVERARDRYVPHLIHPPAILISPPSIPPILAHPPTHPCPSHPHLSSYGNICLQM
jgi:hypothetical protein